MIIAEIGWNFLGDISLAKKMIKSAGEQGCAFVKFQLWDPKFLKPGPWDKDGRREIYNKAYLSSEKYKELYDYSNSLNIKCFASVFNQHEYNKLLNVSNSIIKIPSMEAYDQNLIKKSLFDFELVIVSTGAMKKKELESLKKYSNQKNLIIMHCVSSYPLKYHNFNFEKFNYIKNNFEKYGYSGHCEGIDDAIFALSNGSSAVEKHFTIDKNLPGRDNKFAILPHELKLICQYYAKCNLMRKELGLELQEEEKEVYENYRGRWKN